MAKQGKYILKLLRIQGYKPVSQGMMLILKMKVN